MADRRQIIKSIAPVAKRLGHTPTEWEFLSRAGMTEYAVSQCFPRWNDALCAAGLRPYTRNARVEDSELLKDWGESVRRARGMPEHRAHRREGKYDPRTIEKRFGRCSTLPRAFRKFAKGKREWADVLALLPTRTARKRAGKIRRRWLNRKAGLRAPWYARRTDRPTYGNPTLFRWLLYEPVNEQGVVLLFGMLAKDLGYLVENVQMSFPDCEAMRQIAAGRWQRVRIEFEFESRNFRDHGHPANGCDVIVCWRHNWPDCPGHIEVLELSSIIKS
jgi:hypothetical protein